MIQVSFSASLLLGFLLINATVAERRVCETLRITSANYAVHRDSVRLSKTLTDYVAKCQNVIGDLIIEDFGINLDTLEPIDANIQQLSTSFLDSIIEISGRLVIRRVYLRTIALYNLRIIRGENLFNAKSFYALDVTNVVHPTSLWLPMLSAITGAGARISGNMDAELYCFLTRKVDWNTVFQNDRLNSVMEGGEPIVQKLSFDSVFVKHNGKDVPSNKIADLCSAFSCDIGCKEDNLGCWSIGGPACQHYSKCKSSTCKTCYTNYLNGVTYEGCCDPSCLGGCIMLPFICIACPHVLDGSVCRKDCSYEETGKAGLKRIGNLCVEKCNLPFVTSSDGSHCLIKCPTSQTLVNGVCTKCKDQTCKSCFIPTETFGDTVVSLVKKEQCAVWRTDESISSLIVDGGRLVSPNSLSALENLQFFYGKLFVRNFDWRQENLRFLRNLRSVSERLGILHSKITYLGLAKLSDAKELWIRNISGLCRAWYPKKWISSTKKFPITVKSISFADSSKACRDAACDPTCLNECWGPGPDMCVA